MVVKDLRKELEMERPTVLSGICELGGFCFKIPCYSQVQPVDDDSGSGKTYFIKKLKFYLQSNIPERNRIVLTDGFDISRLHAILHPKEFDYISDNYYGHFFIVDRFNKATEEQMHKVQNLVDNRCAFLLFSRYYIHICDGGPDVSIRLNTEIINDEMIYFKFYKD